MIYKGKWAKGMMRWAATYDAIKTLSQKCGLLGLSLTLFQHCTNTTHKCDSRIFLEQQ